MTSAINSDSSRVRDLLELKDAYPIWLRGLHRERNIQAGFRCDLQLEEVPEQVVLRVTAASLYRAFVNGEFVSYGPAKPPHGYARVDEVQIGRYLRPGINRIAIEVAGYNDRNFYLIDDPSFLLVEVEAAGRVLTATGEDWRVIRLPRRQQVELHGFQRSFSEIWDLDEVFAQWRTADVDTLPFAAPEIVDVQRKLLPQHVPLPTFELSRPAQIVSVGTMVADPDRPVTPSHVRDGGFADDEVTEWPSLECARERSGPDSDHGFRACAVSGQHSAAAGNPHRTPHHFGRRTDR